MVGVLVSKNAMNPLPTVFDNHLSVSLGSRSTDFRRFFRSRVEMIDE